MGPSPVETGISIAVEYTKFDAKILSNVNSAPFSKPSLLNLSLNVPPGLGRMPEQANPFFGPEPISFHALPPFKAGFGQQFFTPRSSYTHTHTRTQVNLGQ